ncbi:5-bromo-4-chloroindolyl phosphate hydrolysis family protein [Salicola sp. Rm-C-2C1-2]|uniref:5-bromo-4-chloroindolyl phosphate hydrolysis family protein n=1 Tax=Salicola sp. Rm-C-2C1-2 TaxID=3141321 RepID=UPI0032E513FB
MAFDAMEQWRPSVLQRSLLAGIGASVAFVAAHGVLTMPYPSLLYSTVLGLMVFAGLSLALPRRRSLSEVLAQRQSLEGGDLTNVSRFVEENRAQVARMQALRDDMDEQTRTVIDEIVDWANRIIDGVVDDPGDIARSTRFEVHLETAVEVTQKVVDLRRTDSANASESVQEVVAKSYTVLCDIRDLFIRQYEKNLENDVLDVDVDLDVLSKTLKREGY